MSAEWGVQFECEFFWALVVPPVVDVSRHDPCPEAGLNYRAAGLIVWRQPQRWDHEGVAAKRLRLAHAQGGEGAAPPGSPIQRGMKGTSEAQLRCVSARAPQIKLRRNSPDPGSATMHLSRAVVRG